MTVLAVGVRTVPDVGLDAAEWSALLQTEAALQRLRLVLHLQPKSRHVLVHIRQYVLQTEAALQRLRLVLYLQPKSGHVLVHIRQYVL